jgi:hypothetical protein
MTAKVSFIPAGALGIIKDIEPSELPQPSMDGGTVPAVWSDGSNVRFLDGAAHQTLGYGQVFNSPSAAPQYLMQANVGPDGYWLYPTATKVFAVSSVTGSSVHTDITPVTPRAGTENAWSGFVFGGVPILNAGDGKPPMYWDQNLAHKFADLAAWPANTSCKVLRQYKNLMIALNVTEGGVNKPVLVMWSSPADPGALPSTWDKADTTQDAGRFDIAEGQDPIIDGLGLKDSFIVYKQSSTWALDYIGGQFVLKNRKVSGMSGLLNMNCAVAFEAAGFAEMHFAVTGFDIVIHDGYAANSVLDKKARRYFFQNIDVENKQKVFVFKNPFLNEIYVAYPSIGATNCNRALVYNFVDKTVTFRDLPGILHAACGPLDNSLGGNWNQDSDPWSTDNSAWNGPDYTPDSVRVMMGSADAKLFLLDASASFDGALPTAYLERRGLHFDAPDRLKTVMGVRPRISGNAGGTVLVKIAATERADDEPVWITTTYTIGQTLQCDAIVTGRYIHFRFETGAAYSWRLDGFDVLINDAGEF